MTAVEPNPEEVKLTWEQVERACIVLHDAYEAAAVQHGWETQERSQKPWSDVPVANQATMRSAVYALFKAGFGDVAAEREAVGILIGVRDRETARAKALQARIDAALAMVGSWDVDSFEATQGALANEVRQLLTVDQPAPTPEPVTFVEHEYEGNTFFSPTPEPPHLDPKPYACGNWRSVDGDAAGYDFDTVFFFAPRPADENGKPYSQDRADYEGGQK